MRIFEGSDGFFRDFIHVFDIVKINMHFFKSKKSGIYNAGTGKARSFQDIAYLMKTMHGSGEIEFISIPSDLRGKYQEFTEADLSNLHKANFTDDFISLEDGIRQYYDLLSTNEGIYT